MECLLPYLSMVTVPHIMVGLERMLDYRGVGLERFHCIYYYTCIHNIYLCILSLLIIEISHACTVCMHGCCYVRIYKQVYTYDVFS